MPPSATFAEVVRKADRIEVRSERMPPDAAPLFTVTGERAGEDFIRTVRIDPLAGPLRCRCGVAHRLTFFHNGERLADVGLHNQRRLSWPEAGSAGDLTIAGERGFAFGEWMRENGGNIFTLYSGPPVLDAATVQKQRDEADQAVVACFPPAATQVVQIVGSMRREGWQPWLEPSALRELVPDAATLAASAFRAAGILPNHWLEDDYRTAAIQTAVAELSPDDFMRAFRAHADDDRAMRGAARIYLRLRLAGKFSRDFNAEAVPRMADAMLRTGEGRDKPVALIYLAEMNEPAAWNFLREIATGRRSYPWPTECQLYYLPHEPSLRRSAALLLALRGDRDAAELAAAAPTVVLGLDETAQAVAKALLESEVIVPPAAFRYESHVLGYGAAEAVVRTPPQRLRAAVVSAALSHEDHWVRARVRPVAQALGLDQYRPSAEVNLFAAPVEQRLATERPDEAIRQCTERLADAKGPTRTALLIIRAAAHEAVAHPKEATTDYEAALKSGGYSPEILHAKLGWLKFYQGRFIEAVDHVEAALRLKPDADLHFLRGLIRYATDDFRPHTEMDFTTALGLAPGNGYAKIFQHLTSTLGGRPEWSRLRVDAAANPQTPPPTTLTVGPSSITIDTGASEIPWWPAQVLRFFRGEIGSDELVSLGRRHPVLGVQQTCEAHYYVAQAARLAGNVDEERAALKAAVATKAEAVGEFRMAQVRLSVVGP